MNQILKVLIELSLNSSVNQVSDEADPSRNICIYKNVTSNLNLFWIKFAKIRVDLLGWGNKSDYGNEATCSKESIIEKMT